LQRQGASPPPSPQSLPIIISRLSSYRLGGRRISRSTGFSSPPRARCNHVGTPAPSPRKKTPPIAPRQLTPLPRVMLVLRVIFMITAPMLQQGVNVALPKVGAQPLGVVHDQLVLAITSDGSVRLDGAPLAVNEISGKLTPLLGADPNRSVHVRADKNVP